MGAGAVVTCLLHILVLAAAMIQMGVVALKIESQRFLSLAVSMGCSVVIMLAKTLSLFSDNLPELMALFKMESLGLCYFLFFGLAFLNEWKQVGIPHRYFFVLFVLNTLFFVAMVTFDRHWLFYSTVGLGESAFTMSGKTMAVEGGPLYYAHLFFVVLQWLMLLAMYVHILRKTPATATVSGRRYRLAVLVCLTLIVIAILGGADVFGCTEFRVLTIGIVTAGWGMVAILYSTYDTVQIAKDNLIEELDECFVVLSRDMRLAFANAAATCLMAETDRELLFASVEKALREKQPQTVIGERTYQLHWLPVQAKERVLGYALNLVDITDVVRQTETMRAMKERAERANRFKSDFISTVSHEIRTPMNVIVGMTDIMLREELPPTLREYLRNIKTSGNNLLAIINDILDVSKVESGKMEIVAENYDLAEFLNDLGLMFMSRIHDKPVDLFFDVDPQLPRTLKGDVVRVRQIIVNLMSNAVKFTERGFVRLSIRVDARRGDDIELRVVVQDTGIGVKEADMAKLFVEFSRVNVETTHHVEGTGLGLALSRKLAKLMGGSLTAQSAWGVGSSFTLSIRQTVVDDAPLAELKGEHRPAVAYVSAVEQRRQFAREIFEAFRLPTVTAEDIARGAGEPEFIFLDGEQYPGAVDGLREKYPAAALVVLRNSVLTSVKDDTRVTAVEMPVYSYTLCQTLNREKDVAKPGKREAAPFSYVAPKAKILLVDDNDMNRVVAKGLLGPLQLTVEEAVNGQEAVALVTKNRYDLVLMDHMMPVMDGIEATKKIRAMADEYYQKLPIIALTANVAADARQFFAEAGMNDFAMKPIDIKQLAQQIRALLPPELVQTTAAEVADAPETEAETQAKTETQAAAEPPQSDAEIAADLAAKLPQLDVYKGINNCGSAELYRKTLGMFAAKIDAEIARLDEYMNANRLEELTIELHALKNNVRTIGDEPLAELFYRLELAGKKEAIDPIRRHLPDAIDRLRELKPLLEPYGGE